MTKQELRAALLYSFSISTGQDRFQGPCSFAVGIAGGDNEK
jgi:hypothetical protein